MHEDDSPPIEKPASVDGASGLLRLADLAQELEAELVAEDARELAARVAERRFYVACVGQFKRGKSSLINALVGHQVVPTGFIPVTAVPTVIRFGEKLSARVRMRDGSWREVALPDLREYVTEEFNPENKKGVDGAEVFVPSPLLTSGMCFVDTPGLGSVFTGNTATTQAFIPHIDAALVVVGADPPIAGEELALVEAVGRQVQDLILVINKADRTTDPERAAAAKFTREILEKRLHRPMGEVLEVSAAERMEERGPLRDWDKLLASLRLLVEDPSRNLVRAACDRGLRRLSEQLIAVVNEDRDALFRPIEESERRIKLMKETISDAERSMRELGFLFMAEQHRISDLFLERHREFFCSAWKESESEFGKELSTVRRGFGPNYRRRAMHLAQEISRNKVMPWLKPEQEEGERQYRAVAMRFVEMGNNFLRKLADAGLSELTRMPHALDPEKGFRIRSQVCVRGLHRNGAASIAVALARRRLFAACGGTQSHHQRRSRISAAPSGSEQLARTKRCSQSHPGKPRPPGGGDPQAAARNQPHCRTCARPGAQGQRGRRSGSAVCD